MKKGAKKRITISDLAVVVTNGFKKTATKDDLATSIDDLALVMAGSFSGLEERLTKKIDAVENGLEGVKKEVTGLKNQLEGTNKRIDDFAETKVSKITYKELEGRVSVVEKRLEIEK